MADNFESKWCETQVRVRYAETDQGGVVYHSNFLVWFEVGRVEFCRDHGFNYRDMERGADAYLPVVEVHVRFRNPAHYDDLILIRTRVVSIKSRAMTFEYEARRISDETILAEGSTHHIVRNSAGKARSLPAEYARLLTGTSSIIP
jgi:acyl-CoA thioester hydrolase